MINILKKMNAIWIIILNIQLQIVVFTQFSTVASANSTELKKIEKIKLRKIVIVGNTVFSENELKSHISKLKGKNIDIFELNNLTKIITDLYIDKGYIGSGAFLPQQDISRGIVKIKIIEGKLEKINIDGLKNLKESYVNSIVGSAVDKPLNINYINEKLNLLRENSSIKNVKAELVKGTTPEFSVLLLKIEERSPFEAKLRSDNYRSPGVGEYQGTFEADYQNLIGVSDRLYGQYSLTDGFDAYSVGYGIPVFKNDGIINFEYRNGDSKIIENFREIDIRAESDSILLGYRQPVIYTSDDKVSIGIGFERQQSQTFILDDRPYSFTDGPQEGRSVVSVLKLTGDWQKRLPNSFFTINSQLNFGLDLFDATVNDDAPDGLFFSWLGQAQWTQALNQDKDLLLVTGLATQLSPDSLLPLEQFTLGGVGTVRGYRQNQEVGDNAVVGTIELYVPLIGDRISSSKLNLVPFFDGGIVWDNNSNESKTLASLGLGLDWQFKEFLSLKVDWGLPLINTGDRGNSLQDNGFSFSLEIKPF